MREWILWRFLRGTTGANEFSEYNPGAVIEDLSGLLDMFMYNQIYSLI